MDEQAVINDVRRGQAEAFGLLVRHYQARLRGFVAQYLENSHDVYDIVQDAFLDAFRNLGSFDTQREFYPWLRAICRNRLLNFLRSRRVRRGVDLVDAAIADRVEASTAEPADSLERLEALRQCIDQLPAAQRDLLDIRYVDRVPVKELAERLRRSAASVSMQLHRLRAILLECVSRRLELANP